jgi:hypothetical protein
MIKNLLLSLLFITPAFAEDIGVVTDPVQSMSITFSEALDRSAPFSILKPGAIREAKNMKRVAPGVPSGWTSRRGMSAHNSTAIGTETIDSLHQYTNKDFGTDVFLAQYNRRYFYNATNTPPTSGTTFGTEIYDSGDSTDGVAICDHINDDLVCALDGATPFAWSGGTAYPDGFVVAQKFSNITRNVLENGTFDEDIFGWAEDEVVGEITEGGYIGSSVNVEKDSSPSSYTGLCQKVYLASGSTYTVSGYAKRVEGSSNAFIRVYKYVSGAVSSTPVSKSTSSYDWTFLSDTFTADPYPVYYKICLSPAAGEIASYDNVGIYQSGSKTVYRNGYSKVRNSDTTKSISFLQDSSSNEQAYIGFRRPINGVYLYLGSVKNTVNATMSVAAMKNGVWTAVSGLSDGTSLSNKTLARNGAITWTADATVDPYVVETTQDQLYWYRFTVNANISDGVSIYECRVYETEAQELSNLSSGILQSAGTVILQSGDSYTPCTVEAIDGDSGTIISTPYPFTTNEAIYIGFPDELFAIYLQIGAGANQTQSSGSAVVETYDAYNGWQNITSLIDGTSDGSYAFAQSGYLQWDASSVNPSKTLMPEFLFLETAEIPLYWYKITVTGNSAVSINEIGGLASGGEVTQYKGVSQFYGRAIWWPSDLGSGGVDYSQFGFPHILNGDDSASTGSIFGEGEVNAFVTMDDKAIVSTKTPYRLYALSGQAPSEYVSDIISSTIGAIAPNAMVFVNGGIKLFSRDSLANAVAMLAPDGVYLTNGRTVVDISSPISDYFDTSSAPYIEPTTMDQSYAWVNYDEKTVHFAVPVNTSGSGTQSTLNRELVYNYILDEWYDVYQRQYPAACGITLYGSNRSMSYIGDYDGKVFRANTGKLDVLAEIDHYIKTAAISPLLGTYRDYLNYKADILGIKLKAGADTASGSEAKLSVYKDGSSSGVSIGDISLERSGYSYINDYLRVDSGTTGTPLTGEEFEFKFDNESVDSSVMTLYGFTIDFKPVRPTY